VHIDLSFVIIMGLIGWLSGARTARDIGIWLAVAAVSVLTHELGHALVARTTGASPEVALTGFGGVTTYVPPQPLSRLRSLAISLAGPFVGLAIGFVLIGVRLAIGPDLEPYSWQDVAIRFGLFTSFGWSILNLVPVLPLDGGQAMRELLPGDPELRSYRAAVVSVVVLAPLLVWALVIGWWSIAFFVVLFGFGNLQAVRNGRPGTQREPAGGGLAAGLTPEQVVVGLLWQGSPWPARATLEQLPEGVEVDLAVHGAVLAATDQPEQGMALLRQELARRPGDVNVVALLVLVHVLRRDWDALEADLRGPYAASVPLTVVERALAEAQAQRRPDVVARINALPRP
jgi:Zn-dependent protease